MARFSTPAAEESVGCNLIPMIDIMFLLLLFFMLGADMTKREQADVVLPAADRAITIDPRETSPTTTVNVSHRDARVCRCAVHEDGGNCSDPAHWMVSIRGDECVGGDLLRILAIEAARNPEPPDPKDTRKRSLRKIMIRADRSAPFGAVRAVITACSESGLYRIEVGAANEVPPTG